MTHISTDRAESDSGLALFETAIGTCGIAWSERGVIGVQLPDDDSPTTLAKLRRRFPQMDRATAPVDVLLAIGRIVALLRGERVDLTPVRLDLDIVPEFDREVYVAARQIPPGATRTYGEIAKQIGSPHAARDVGVALARNPFAIVVPCHRVVQANGKTGGFSAPGGVKTKLKLLAIEGGAGPLFDQATP
jgi:methylated-DNA-[protein]-cysteine S-methyltransferase